MNKNLAVALLTLLFSMSGCTSVKSINPWHKNNKVKALSLFVTQDPNLRHAVDIDVVFVYGEIVYAVVSDIDSVQWFEQKAGILSGYGDKVKIKSWELVKGFGVQSNKLPKRSRKATAVFAFVDDPQNPNAKAVISDFKTPWIVYDSGKLMVSDAAPNSAQMKSNQREGGGQ